MVTDPWPPDAANDEGVLLTLTWHLSAVGAVSDVLVLLHARDTAAQAIASAIATYWIRHRMIHLNG
jgi:hypothetical protein